LHKLLEPFEAYLPLSFRTFSFTAMPAIKKTAASTKSSATKPAAAKAKTGAKKAAPSTSLIKRASTPTVVIAHPITPSAAMVPKKATAKKTNVSATSTRTSNPRTSTATITKITRNIVGFYLTEEIETRRTTRSDNKSSEKLKAKYAELKTKIKSR
jgi:hypothetical protein